MEKISFIGIALESWRLSFRRQSFFFFGGLIALPLALQHFLKPLPEEFTLAAFSEYVAHHPFGIALLFIGAFLISILGKSGLILLLDQTTRRPTPEKTPSVSIFSKALRKAALLDVSLFVFLALLVLVLSLPVFLALFMLGTIPSILTWLFLLILLPVVIIIFFVREFTYFYFLLSPLPLKASFEAGANLFVRHRSLSLTFGFFSFFITLLFTFSFNIVMLGIVAVLQRIVPSLSENILFFIGILLCFSWYEVFRQTLWFLFFHTLAAPKNSLPEEEAAVLLEKKISEIPGV